MSVLIICLLMPTSAETIRGGKNPDRDLAPRIIGGDDAPAGRYPYAVSLQDDLSHFCGGSLIAPDVVLTAAHCSIDKFKVVVYRHNLNQIFKGDVIDVSFQVTHPWYNRRTTNNDFNLVFLTRPTNADVKPVKLNSDSSVPHAGDLVTVMGWGDTAAADNLQRLSAVLQDVDLNVISNEKCQESRGFYNGWFQSYDGAISSSMICAKDDHEDSCQGDSGGPLVIIGSDSSGAEDVQVGVVSWGIGCASSNFPGVYARVSSVYDWVRDEVCRKSIDPPSHFECGDIKNAYGNSNGGGIEDSSPSASGSSSESWIDIIIDNFLSGFGFFDTKGTDVLFYKSVKNRVGVLRMQSGQHSASEIYSNKIVLDHKYSKLRISFSFYANSMEYDDSFCLDYKVDGGVNWNDGKCWKRYEFDNSVWYDDVSLEFQGVSSIESLWVRFRCDANSFYDDVLIDSVKIQGFVGGDEPV